MNQQKWEESIIWMQVVIHRVPFIIRLEIPILRMPGLHISVLQQEAPMEVPGEDIVMAYQTWLILLTQPSM